MKNPPAHLLPVIALIVALASAWFGGPLLAQEAGALPDKPMTAEQLGTEAYEAWRSPFEEVVTKNAITSKPAVPESANLGVERNNINLFNVHGCFEPMAFRPKVRPVATSPNTVVLDAAHALAIAEGFYDGARVRVYQAIDGKLELIRDAKVPPGGITHPARSRSARNSARLPAPPSTR